jgi:hypothetical protein
MEMMRSTHKMNLESEKQTKSLEPQIPLEIMANPQLQIQNTKQLLNEVVKRAGDDLKVVTNRKAKTLLETTIALVQGLIKAYEHYERCWKHKNAGQLNRQKTSI